MELKYVKRIYVLLFAMILINPLLKDFIKVTTVLRSMELFCFIAILLTEYKLYRCGCLKKFRSYEKWLYALLAIISAITVIRGQWPASPKDFGLHVLSTPMYLLPFVIVPLPNEKYFREIIKTFYAASLFVIPLWLLNLSDLVQIHYEAEAIGSSLPFISAFLVGLGAFFTDRQKKVNIALWLIYFLLMMLNARRNVSFSLLLYVFIAYLFSVFGTFKKNSLKLFLSVLGSALIVLSLLLSMDTLTSGIFKSMADRAKEDTRSGVEELFFADFAKSPASDWIFGRGMDGGYYQVGVNEETGEISDSRKGIETGYLNMMLKGGIAYDTLIILIMLLAIKRGYARKDKTFSFIATILLTYFIDMYTTNPVCTFSVRSILFWFSISVLSSPRPRQRRLAQAQGDTCHGV